MYPHGAHPSLTPSISRPRVASFAAPLPVPLHVTSSRKVHRSADGIINIIQEISFYAEGGVKSLAGKQLKEVHAQPDTQTRGRFSAETNARVFVGSSLIRMHIQTAIRPNNSDSLEIDEVFHFAEHQDATVFPIAFEATLEREEGEHPAVEFDLASAIVVTLKQRILKDPGEQYKVLQAIELRANEAETRPTQELARKSTITQPTNEHAQFRERIFAGTDVLRVDRDIIFVCNRPVLSLSERREYMPSCPMAPRRRSASLTQSVPRVNRSPAPPRSRSQSPYRSDDSDNLRTANEDLPTATSPYSLREDASNSLIPPCSGLRTGREASPTPSAPRSSRSQRKKWTVNSVVAKAGTRTPERYERARTMRSLSTARNLSLSPVMNSNHQGLKTARAFSPNGEIPAIQPVTIMPTPELGPHGECTASGLEVLKLAGPADSLIRTCAEGRSPTRTRSSSDCSTAGEISTCASGNKRACDSPPFSSPRVMSETGEWAYTNRPSTPVRTARGASPGQQRAPSSVSALDKRRGLFGYGTRPTTPTRSSRSIRVSPHAASPGLHTARCEPSPMRTAQRIVLSPVHTAVHVKRSSRDSSQKSQKESHKESKRSGKRSSRPISVVPPSSDYRAPSPTNLRTARNLFGTVATNESVTSMLTARRGEPTSPAGAVRTARPLATSPYEPAHEKPPASYYSNEKVEDTFARNSTYGMNVNTARETRSPNQSMRTARNSPYDKTARERSPACGLPTARGNTARSPALMTARQSPYDKSARSPAPRTAVPYSYDQNVRTGREFRTPDQSTKTARQSPYNKTARERSPACGLPTARGNTARSPALMTARQSPYDQNLRTGREARSPNQSTKTARQSPYDKSARSPALCTAVLSPYEQNVYTGRAACSPAQSLKTARNSPYGKTARERSPACGLPTARGNTARSPALMTARQSPYDHNVVTGRETRSPGQSLKTARQSPYDKSARSPALATAVLSPYENNVYTGRAACSPAQSIRTARNSPYDKTARERSHASPARGLPTARGHTDRSPTMMTARQSSYDQNVRTGREFRTPDQSTKTARQSPYDKTARERSPACGLPTARANTARSPALMTARQSPYDKSARSPALRTATQLPYEQNVITGRESRSPDQSLRTARQSPYDKSARSPALCTAVLSPYENNVYTGRAACSPAQLMRTASNSPYDKTARERSPACGLPTARGNTERSPTMMTARQAPCDKSARSPAPRTAVPYSYEQNIMTSLPSPVHSLKTARPTSREFRTPDQSTKTARQSPYDKTARERSPACGLPTARGNTVRSPALMTARQSPYDKSARSPASGMRTAAEYGRSPAAPRTAIDRSHSPAGDDDGAYTQVVTARAVSPYAGPRDFSTPLRPSMTARDQTSARSPLVATGRDALSSTQSCISGGRSDGGFSSRSPARSPMATSRTQSPCTRSTISNVVTAQRACSPHVDTGSPNNLATAREQRSPCFTPLRTGRERTRGPAAASPMNLKTARESPAHRLRTAAARTPEHNTMPDSQARQEDSYSEQSQFTFQKTPGGYTQKPTHSSDLATGQQRTPTKTDNDTMYYSARQTTPSRTLRPDDVTLTKRTPKRDFSQHALKSAPVSPLVRTAVDNSTPRKLPKLEEMPKCSLKTGCQATHAPRVIPSCPDSDRDREDSPVRRPIVVAKTPERSLRTARGPVVRTPSAPQGDMRTPRTARATPSAVSSHLRSPAPSSHMITAMSPDAASSTDNSNEDMATARRNLRSAASPRALATARHRDWAAAAAQPTAAAATKPRVIVRANQADGKILVEVCLSFKLNTTGTIRVRGEMVPALHPRTVSVNGQQIWSDSSRH